MANQTPGDILLNAFTPFRNDVDAIRNDQKLTIKELTYGRKELIDFLKQQGLYTKALDNDVKQMVKQLEDVVRNKGQVSLDLFNKQISRMMDTLVAQQAVGRSNSLSGADPNSILYKSMLGTLDKNEKLLIDLLRGTSVLIAVGDRIASQFKDLPGDSQEERNHKEKGKQLGQSVAKIATSKNNKELISNIWEVGKSFTTFLLSMPFLTKLGTAIGDAVGRATTKAVGEVGKLVLLLALSGIRNMVGPITAAVQGLRFLTAFTPKNAIGKIAKTTASVAKAVGKQVSPKLAGGVANAVSKAGKVAGKVASSPVGKVGKFIGKGGGPLALLAAGATYKDNLDHGDSKAKALTKTILSHTAGALTYAGITGGAAAATGGLGGLAVQGGAIAASAGAQAVTNSAVDKVWDFFAGKGKGKEGDKEGKGLDKGLIASTLIGGPAGALAYWGGKKAKEKWDSLDDKERASIKKNVKMGAIAAVGGASSPLILSKILSTMEEQGDKEDQKGNLLQKFFDWLKDMWPWGHKDKTDGNGGGGGGSDGTEPKSGGDFGNKLASAISRISGGIVRSTGRCALKVGDAFESVLGKKAGSYRGHGWQWKDKLDNSEYFNKGKVATSNEDLKNLPAGSVVVWGKQKAHPFGHVEVSDGKGKLISDFARSADLNLYKSNPEGVKPIIYIPKSATSGSAKATEEPQKQSKELVSASKAELSTEEKIKRGETSSSITDKPGIQQKNEPDYSGNQDFCTYIGHSGIKSQMAQYMNYNCGTGGVS